MDFSQPGAPTSNILYNAVSASTLTVAGGVLAIQGKAGANNSQAFNGLTVNPGGSAIVLLSAASNSLALNLGSITDSQAGTVDFTLPGGTQSAVNGITTTNPNTNGILGGFATVSGTDWATSTGTAGNIVAYSAYTTGDLGTLSSNGTLNVEPSGPQTAVTSAKSFNSLNLTGTVGVAMSGSGSLTLLSGGLIGNTSGIITGGTLAGWPSGELMIATPRDLTIGSAIAASVLAKSGTGKLTLLAANGYTGTTFVGNGVLLLSNANAAQSSTLNVAVDNGLQFTGGIGTFNVGSIAGGGALLLTDTGGGAVTVVAGGNNASTTYSGAIRGGGTLVHGGSGTLTLGGQNTFTGGLVLESNAAVFTSAASPGEGSVSFDGNSTIEVTGNMTIPNPFVSENGATGTVNTGPYTLTLSGTISGPGGMVKFGPGTVILTNSNSISGPTAINQGTLQLANSAALINSTVSVNNDHSLTFSSSIGSFTVGGLAGGGALALADAGGGALNLVGGGNSQNTTYSGAISGPGTLTKAGNGSLDLTGTSSWTGGLALDPGIVAFNGDLALGASSNRITFVGSGTLQADCPVTLSAARNISINSGVTATFDPNGNTVVVGGPISGGGTLA